MPSTQQVLDSLDAAADAAHKAYMAALAANPGADLGELYKKEMAAAAAAAAAVDKALNGDPAVAAAQAQLDAATKDIKAKLQTLKDIAQWINLLDSLVQLATKVSGFFA